MIDSGLKMYVESQRINVQGIGLLEEALEELRPLRVYNKANPDRFREINSLITKIEDYIFTQTKERISERGLF